MRALFGALATARFLGRTVRCARCGLTARLVGPRLRRRFKIDADAWGQRCKALSDARAPNTPSECPHLSIAMRSSRGKHRL